MSRCKACDDKLEEFDLRRGGNDNDFCSNCRYQSSLEYNIHDRQYDHSDITGVPLDGTTITIEESGDVVEPQLKPSRSK